MATFKIDEEAIRKLAALLEETKLSEIEYENAGQRIRLSRGGSGPAIGYAGPMANAPVATAAPAAAASSADDATHPGAVKSPMVGTAYLSPQPGAPVFVKLGDSVTAGQTILIIEAMKTFNPIKATKAGKLAKFVVGDGQPVEFGEVLAIIE
ncbi:MAG: acetyl-CoA carboxylase biotin carboxyl carrier protein subunit [Rhodospirillales bacterium]